MIDYGQLVAEAVAGVELVSATSHRWFGLLSQDLSPEAARTIDSGSARAYLVHNLKAQLYANFYCAGRARPALDVAVLEPPAGTSPFVQALSEANTGTYAREPGWTIVRQEGGSVVVARGGLSLWMSPAELYATNGDTLTSGTAVGVLMPKELLRLSPGFYMALGQAEFPVDGSVPMVRFYWNLRSEGAAPLVAALTRRLNAEGLAFRLKVVNNPMQYSRCDAGVLYAMAAQYEPVSRAVAEVYPSLAPLLKPTPPALTKTLAPGLGFAEDPGGALSSFGMHRCELLAEGIVRAAELGLADPGQRFQAVAARLAEDGISLDAPYLNPGSVDRYELPAP